MPIAKAIVMPTRKLFLLLRFLRKKTAIDELRSEVNNKSLCSTTKTFLHWLASGKAIGLGIGLGIGRAAADARANGSVVCNLVRTHATGPTGPTTRCSRRFQKSHKTPWTMPCVPDTYFPMTFNPASAAALKFPLTFHTDQLNYKPVRKSASNAVGG